MDEVWARAGLVAGVLIVAGAVVAVLRARATGPVRQVETPGLEPGVYLFSSTDCSTCRTARAKLDAALGADGYREMVWEDQPGVFAALDIDAVPAVVLVSVGGRGSVYPGQPDEALRAL